LGLRLTKIIFIVNDQRVHRDLNDAFTHLYPKKLRHKRNFQAQNLHQFKQFKRIDSNIVLMQNTIIYLQKPVGFISGWPGLYAGLEIQNLVCPVVLEVDFVVNSLHIESGFTK